jgi:superfamily II DNA or RNA helicase
LSRRAQIHINNARSRIENVRPEIFRLLRHELSFMTGEPGWRRHMQADGSVKTHWWDGYRRLLQNNGSFPSGLLPRLIRLMRKWSVGFELNDHRRRPDEQVPLWAFRDDFELRGYQLADCDAAERWGRGIIDSPPRSGKTIMMAELLRRLSAPLAVVTAPTKPIAEQTHAKLLELFRDWASPERDISDDFYLLTGGAPKSVKGNRALDRARVIIATADTAVTMPTAFWEKVEALIVDERHHQAAKTYHKLSDKAVNAYYRWGFTGTNFRSKGGEQIAMEACLGRVVVSHSIKEMTDQGVLVPAVVEFWPVDYDGLRTIKYARAYPKGVVESGERNELVALAAGKLLQEGRKVLVLVARIEHGERLATAIPGSQFIQGKDGEEVRRAVAKLDSGKLRCLIGSPVVGEGLDCPSASGLVYAKGNQAKVTHVQDVFRVMTGHPGKADAKIIDFADRHNEGLIEHSVERMRHYHEMGMRVEVLSQDALDTRQLDLPG